MEKEYDKTRRKWVTQMTDTEVTVLQNVIKTFNGWKLSDHALDEMDNDNVTMYEVAEVLKMGRVLEVNNVAAYDICVMMRRNVGLRSIAVVVSVVTGKVKTVYTNPLHEDERQPKMENYRWKADVSGIDRVAYDNLSRVRALA